MLTPFAARVLTLPLELRRRETRSGLTGSAQVLRDGNTRSVFLVGQGRWGIEPIAGANLAPRLGEEAAAVASRKVRPRFTEDERGSPSGAAVAAPVKPVPTVPPDPPASLAANRWRPAGDRVPRGGDGLSPLCGVSKPVRAGEAGLDVERILVVVARA